MNTLPKPNSAIVIFVGCVCLMIGKVSLAATLIWGSGLWGDSWSTSASSGAAPSELSGATLTPADKLANSVATYAIGLTLDNGQSYTSTASVSETIQIVGVIRPEAAHIGQSADIFVVDRVNQVFTMKTPEGVYIPWNGTVASLQAALEDVELESIVTVDIFTGKLSVSGDHRIFIGYMPADGKLRYTPVPLRLTFTE